MVMTPTNTVSDFGREPLTAGTTLRVQSELSRQDTSVREAERRVIAPASPSTNQQFYWLRLDGNVTLGRSNFFNFQALPVPR